MIRVLLFLSTFIIAAATGWMVYLSAFAGPLDVDRTRAWLGSGPAAYRVALAYEQGTNVEQNLPAARKWYRAAHARGVDASTINLALMHLRGTGGPKDEQGALELFRDAAARGDVQAQMNAARCAFLGIGMDKNDEEGAKWVRMAAEGGAPAAKALMGMLYLGGIGVEQRFSEAVKWLRSSQDAQAQELADRLNLIGETINHLPEEKRDAKWKEAYGTMEAEIRGTFNDILKNEFLPAR